MVFSVYPHLAVHRRRGTSSKDVFVKYDPLVKGTGAFSLNSSQENKTDVAVFGKRSSELDVNKGIGVPTLKMLNPELFKEMEKAEK